MLAAQGQQTTSETATWIGAFLLTVSALAWRRRGQARARLTADEPDPDPAREVQRRQDRAVLRTFPVTVALIAFLGLLLIVLAVIGGPPEWFPGENRWGP